MMRDNSKHWKLQYLWRKATKDVMASWWSRGGLGTRGWGICHLQEESLFSWLCFWKCFYNELIIHFITGSICELCKLAFFFFFFLDFTLRTTGTDPLVLRLERKQYVASNMSLGFFKAKGSLLRIVIRRGSVCKTLSIVPGMLNDWHELLLLLPSMGMIVRRGTNLQAHVVWPQRDWEGSPPRQVQVPPGTLGSLKSKYLLRSFIP